MRRDLSRLSPLPSYSYAIHTVSPPRPLIPVSWGGVQTGEQTGGWVTSLFIRCLTRRAWRSISHLQNFSHGISMRLRKQWVLAARGNPDSYNRNAWAPKWGDVGLRRWLCGCCETSLRLEFKLWPRGQIVSNLILINVGQLLIFYLPYIYISHKSAAAKSLFFLIV